MNRVALLAACRAVVGTKPWKKPRMPRSRAMMGTAWRKPRNRGFGSFLSSILVSHVSPGSVCVGGNTYSMVLMLSVGVTASSDSVTPAPKPAMTVRGPESLPSASTRNRLYWSKATKPSCLLVPYVSRLASGRSVRMPAFIEFPRISVVHPAYH